MQNLINTKPYTTASSTPVKPYKLPSKAESAAKNGFKIGGRVIKNGPEGGKTNVYSPAKKKMKKVAKKEKKVSKKRTSKKCK
jgi:hypothetical protein